MPLSAHSETSTPYSVTSPQSWAHIIAAAGLKIDVNCGFEFNWDDEDAFDPNKMLAYDSVSISHCALFYSVLQTFGMGDEYDTPPTDKTRDMLKHFIECNFSFMHNAVVLDCVLEWNNFAGWAAVMYALAGVVAGYEELAQRAQEIANYDADVSTSSDVASVFSDASLDNSVEQQQDEPTDGCSFNLEYFSNPEEISSSDSSDDVDKSIEIFREKLEQARRRRLEFRRPRPRPGHDARFRVSYDERGADAEQPTPVLAGLDDTPETTTTLVGSESEPERGGSPAPSLDASNSSSGVLPRLWGRGRSPRNESDHASPDNLPPFDTRPWSEGDNDTPSSPQPGPPILGLHGAQFHFVPMHPRPSVSRTLEESGSEPGDGTPRSDRGAHFSQKEAGPERGTEVLFYSHTGLNQVYSEQDDAELGSGDDAHYTQ
ncbi:hypothetical protein BC834DRAFT_843394 [Gloeopeniophorella convolvens]|nr:hypothetical protein BC834DRAFT_843394 [Gloeopeniophorella convolvens]